MLPVYNIAKTHVDRRIHTHKQLGVSSGLHVSGLWEATQTHKDPCHQFTATYLNILCFSFYLTCFNQVVAL